MTTVSSTKGSKDTKDGRSKRNPYGFVIFAIFVLTNVGAVASVTARNPVRVFVSVLVSYVGFKGTGDTQTL